MTESNARTDLASSATAELAIPELAIPELAIMDATDQAALVRRGEATPLELVDAAIARIEAVNPQLNAVIHPLFDKAREQARGPLPAATPDAPFRGVPMLFKDLMCAVAGDPYHRGSNALKRVGHLARHTDDLAQRYLEAGFICIGRTNTPEFGLVPTTEPHAHGPSRNPWDPSRTTGGSSGGSAAAVASGMVPVAHANDGGGSIRIPASCNGRFGLKPSRGRTSLGPESGHLSSPLTVEGCISTSVRDTAAVLDAISRPFAGQPVIAPAPLRPFADEVGADPGRLRIGLLVSNPLGTGPVAPDCVAAAEDAARLLESLGHVVEHDFPKSFEDPAVIGHFTALWDSGLADEIAHVARILDRPVTADDVEPLTWEMYQGGLGIGAQQLLDAVHALESFGRDVGEWWLPSDDSRGFDLLLSPTLAEPPVPLGTFENAETPILGFLRAAAFAPFCAGFNLTGQPAITVPLFWNAAGLPVGVQLAAAYGREDMLIRIASQLEQARPWAQQRPAIRA
jgi:amidase